MFIGNLSWDTDDAKLSAFFAQAGNVVSANVIKDRQTNRSKGFGFVEMETEEMAQKAKDELNGKELDGRAIAVDEARPQEDRNSGGGNGGSWR